MTCNTTELLLDLKKRVENSQADLLTLSKLSSTDLNKRKNSKSWSALECIAHLNIYGEFYIPEINKNMQSSKFQTAEDNFKSGMLGNYFVKMVGPLDKSKKMKTLTATNTLGSELTESTLTIFGTQLESLLSIIDKASRVSLNRIKVGISIAPFIKIKLGDALRVVILHNQRHMEQALKAIK